MQTQLEQLYPSDNNPPSNTQKAQVVKKSQVHNLTWQEQIVFNDEMRKGECFVGIDSLIQNFDEKNQRFSDKFCLYLEHGMKMDSKD